MNSPTPLVILGCDVSKGWLDIHVHGQEGVTRIANARPAIDAFLKPYRGAAIAIEATNRFHELMLERARRRGLIVYLVSGYELKRYAEAIRRRLRNDPIDAELLSRFLAHEIDTLVPYQPKAPKLNLAFQLLKRRAVLVQQNDQRRQSFSDVKCLARIERMLARQHQRALDLIDAQLRALVRDLGWSNDLARLCAIKGVGELTAYAMLIAYHSGRFVHHDAFVAYLGLDVKAKDSGKRVGQRKLSKRGDGEYRRLLHCAAMAAVRHEPYFRHRYQELCGRGLAKTAALVAIARKLARVAFTLLRRPEITFDASKLGAHPAATPLTRLAV